MADLPVTPLSEKDAPKTFVERGAAVPFTTPALMWARVRQRANIKELLVPGLANPRGIYVFEWAGIPQRFTLTLHARLLHRAIAAEPSPTPSVIARIANRIALSGAAGADVQVAAERRARQAAELVLLARLTLTMRMIARMNGDGSAMTPSQLRTEPGERRAKQLLSEIGGRLKLTPQSFHDRIEGLATVLGEIGLPGMPVKSPARRLLQSLVQITRVLREWADEGKGDAVVEARLVAQVAEETFRLSEQQTAVN